MKTKPLDTVEEKVRESFRKILMRFLVKVTREKMRLVKLELVDWEDPVVETKTLNSTLREIMKLLSHPSDKLKGR